MKHHYWKRFRCAIEPLGPWQWPPWLGFGLGVSSCIRGSVEEGGPSRTSVDRPAPFSWILERSLHLQLWNGRVGTPWHVYDTWRDGGRRGGYWVSKWVPGQCHWQACRCHIGLHLVMGRVEVVDFGKEQGKCFVHGSVASHPCRTCLLMWYSCFPEFVMNWGASLFDPVRTWVFILSVMMHGQLYTAC